MRGPKPAYPIQLTAEEDKHLQPWDKKGNTKPALRDAFDQAHVWVYGDFTLTKPQRRKDFE